jgi:hypothetical protein
VTRGDHVSHLRGRVRQLEGELAALRLQLQAAQQREEAVIRLLTVEQYAPPRKGGYTAPDILVSELEPPPSGP